MPTAPRVPTSRGLCLVCGLDFRNCPDYLPEDWPWGADGMTSSFEYCPCCGVQFGYQDSLLTGVRRCRLQWQEQGMPWSEPGEKPPEWQPVTQMAAIPPRAR